MLSFGRGVRCIEIIEAAYNSAEKDAQRVLAEVGKRQDDIGLKSRSSRGVVLEAC